jgi:hypothetical protein
MQRKSRLEAKAALYLKEISMGLYFQRHSNIMLLF